MKSVHHKIITIVALHVLCFLLAAPLPASAETYEKGVLLFQKKTILSMESVFAAIAGWIIMNQYLDSYKLFGCLCILLGVILVQLISLYANKQKKL